MFFFNYLKAHNNFSLGVPAEVTSIAIKNSLKSIVPLLSASNVRKTFWQNFSASPEGKNILYISMKVPGVSFPLGQSCRNPAYHSLIDNNKHRLEIRIKQDILYVELGFCLQHKSFTVNHIVFIFFVCCPFLFGKNEKKYRNILCLVCVSVLMVSSSYLVCFFKNLMSSSVSCCLTQHDPMMDILWLWLTDIGDTTYHISLHLSPHLPSRLQSRYIYRKYLRGRENTFLYRVLFNVN